MATRPLPLSQLNLQSSNGLALVITNDYNYSTSRFSPLSGTHSDGAKMEHVLKELNYAVITKKNLSCYEMQGLLLEVSQIRYPKSFCSVIVVFSGHGTSDKDRTLSFVVSHDCVNFAVKDLVGPFMPENSPANGNIHKVFLIDACLGERNACDVSVAVPKGNTPTSDSAVACKSGEKVQTINIPPHGNCILAHSTSIGYRSFEVKMNGHVGGVWLDALSYMIRVKGHSSPMSAILEETNGYLMEKYQDPAYKAVMTQPHFTSTAHGSVYLVPQPVMHDAVTPHQEIHVQPVASAVPGVYYSESVYPIVQSPLKPHVLIPQNSTEVIRPAAPVVPGIYYYDPESVHPTVQSPPKAQPGVAQGYEDKGQYRSQLNSMQQSNKISKLVFEDLPKTKNGLFLARVSFIVSATGQRKSFPSSTEKHTLKEAYEEAARVACKNFKDVPVIPKSAELVRRQTSGQLSRQVSIDQNQLQRLKQGCEARKPRLTYILDEIQTNEHQRFQFRVTVKDSSGRVLCTEVGLMQGSKQLAKHDAASKANTKLKF